MSKTNRSRAYRLYAIPLIDPARRDWIGGPYATTGEAFADMTTVLHNYPSSWFAAVGGNLRLAVLETS